MNKISVTTGLTDCPVSFIEGTNRYLGIATGQLYLLCAAVTVYEVIARYFFNSPTKWAFEIVMVLCASAWMLSGGYVALRRGHISITSFYAICSPTGQRFLDLFIHCVGFITLFTFLHVTLEPMLSAIQISETSGTGFDSPLPTILKIVLFAGVCFFWLQIVANFIRDVSTRRAKLIIGSFAVLCALKIVSEILFFYFDNNWYSSTLNFLFSATGILNEVALSIDARAAGVGVATLAVVGGLLVLMLTGMPLALATLTVSLTTALLFFGEQGFFLVSSNATGLLEKYPLVAVPLFVLMASLLERAGIARDLFDAMSIFAGTLRGGVAVQTTAVAVVLAAMTGVLGGEIVMLGLVALPQMLRLGYDRKLAMGTICAGGALATLIPPSIIIIVYGLAASVAIGDLFVAGIIPGLMLAGLYIVYIVTICYLRPQLAPIASELVAETGVRKFETKQALALGMAGFLILVVLGSIYAGISTVTEAAAIGVAGAMLVAAARGRFSLEVVQESLRQTVRTVGMIVWLVLGAVSLVGIYNVIGGNEFLMNFFTDMNASPILVILIMIAVLLVLGTFMEWIAIVFITIPIFAPVVVELAPALGLEPRWAALWFGVLFVMTVQVSFLTPPFGPACFYLKSVAPKDVSLQEIFIAVLPFVAMQIIGISLVVSFPEIVLFLPKLIGG